MRTKYCIGYFLGLFLLLSLMGIGVQIGYQRLQDRQIAHQIIKSPMSEKSLLTKGTAEKEEGFYLQEKNGFVVVYYPDGRQIYEYTNIFIEELPEKLKNEIKTGKYIKSLDELYGILENYTS